MNLFDVLFAKKLAGGGDYPAIIKRVTGNPVEFTDGADAPLIECKSEIQGSQDLHGYDKPWVGGAGKNKLPLLLSKIKTFNTAGTWTGNTYVLNGITYVFQSYDNETITGVNISSNGATGRSVIYYYRDDNAPIVQSQTVTFSGIGGFNRCAYQDGTTWHESTQAYFTATITDGITQIWCELLEGWSGSFTSAPQVEIGSSPTAFTPYANICPITAYTENTISVGADEGYVSNDFSPANGVTKTIESDGVLLSADGITTYQTASIGGVNNLIISPGTYMVSVNVLSVSNPDAFSALGLRKSSYNFVNPNISLNTVGNKSAIITTTESTYISMVLNGGTAGVQNSIKIADFKCIKLAQQSTTTYPSAIYRGSEDVVNGTETHDMECIDLGDLVWDRQEISGYGYRYYATLPKLPLQADTAHLTSICSHYELVVQGGTGGGAHGYAIVTNGTILVYDSQRNNLTPEDWTTYVTGIQLAYTLATTTTTPVTPTNLPIKSLGGYNHIESTTGDLDITYITEGYQEFVDEIESTYGRRKGGKKPIDVFRMLEGDSEPKEEEKKEEEKKEDKK